jgi:hypothetical protein
MRAYEISSPVVDFGTLECLTSRTKPSECHRLRGEVVESNMLTIWNQITSEFYGRRIYGSYVIEEYPSGGGPGPYQLAAADPFSSDRELESCK